MTAESSGPIALTWTIWTLCDALESLDGPAPSYGQHHSEENRVKRENFSSGTLWEPVAGYSRAVRIGNQVWVSGTTATNEAGEIVGAGDAHAKTTQALKIWKPHCRKQAPA